MYPLCSRNRFAFFLAIASLLTAPAIAQSPVPVFLGTTPIALGKLPVSAANISSLGVDADGNQYYADAVAGHVIKVTPSGASTTIATGLTKPLIAVDFLGDVFVADTGTGRVLKVTAWPTRTTTVLATENKLHAIAVDNAENVFLLSGDRLIEIPANGKPEGMATVPGANLLGFGPGAGGTAHLYIVGLQNSAYSAYLYSYNTGSGNGTLSGPLPSFLPSLTGVTAASFFVDLQGNPIVTGSAAGLGEVIIGAAGGYKNTLYTSSISSAPIAQDTYGSLYYLDPANLFKIQLGALNFGAADVPAHADDFTPTLTLNFGASANAGYQLSWTSPDEEFFDDSFQCCGGPLADPAQLNLVFQADIPGYANGSLALLDQNNVTTLSVPLVAIATHPWQAYFLPALNLRAHPSGQAALATETVLSRCQCGTFVLNRKSGQITNNGTEVVSGLLNVQGADVDAHGNLYVTQAGVAGVLRVAANSSTSTIATDIANPGGSAMDNAGNLYVINGEDIIRVASDGSEAVFVSSTTNGGYSSPLSIAVDLFNNVYVGYGVRPNSNQGAILKFTPAGAHRLVRTDTKQPTGLAAYPCGPIYFADAERGTVAVVPADGQEKVIGFGLTNPTNLQCQPQGGVSGQDPGIPGGHFSVSPISFPFTYNFGNVAVGTSRTITLSAVSVGSNIFGAAAGGGEMFPAVSPANPNFLPNQAVYFGTLKDIPLTFKPTSAGPSGTYELDVLDEGDADSFSGLEAIYLSGTGVNPPAAKPAASPSIQP